MNSHSVNYRWLGEIDDVHAREIVQLVDCTVADGGTLGYECAMTPDQHVQFVAALREGLRSGRTHLLLGRVGPEVAFMVLLHLNGMANCRHRAELAKGVVHPRFRGLRLVQLAFQEIARRAEALGVDQLVLDVREHTRAHRLWQLFGFETYGVLDDYARANGRTHRGHFMSQSVQALRARVISAPTLQ